MLIGDMAFWKMFLRRRQKPEKETAKELHIDFIQNNCQSLVSFIGCFTEAGGRQFPMA